MKAHTSALALFVLLTPAAAQAVLVVDATGAGGAFLDIQPAVDAAASGDLFCGTVS